MVAIESSPNAWRIFWAKVKNNTFHDILLWLLIGQLLENFGLLFNLASGHSDTEPWLICFKRPRNYFQCFASLLSPLRSVLGRTHRPVKFDRPPSAKLTSNSSNAASSTSSSSSSSWSKLHRFCYKKFRLSTLKPSILRRERWFVPLIIALQITTYLVFRLKLKMIIGKSDSSCTKETSPISV